MWDLFKDSLLYIQLNTDIASPISNTQAISLIVQRVEHITQICKTEQRRHCYYSMALSIEGCVLIEGVKGDLLNFLQKAETFMDWPPEERAHYIVKLCADFLMPIDDIRFSSKNEEPPECWQEVLLQWLMGKNASEIAVSTKISSEWCNPMKVSTLIDDLCEFRLPWGLNAISMFWKTSATLDQDLDNLIFVPPVVANYFSSMLRFGVHDPVATVALALGLDNRRAALVLAQLYNDSIDPANILTWLHNLEFKNDESITDDQMLQNILHDFIKFVQQNKIFKAFSSLFPKFDTLEVEADFQEAYVEEGMILLSEVENDAIYFYTPDGDYLGPIISKNVDLLREIQRGTISATILNIDRSGEDMLLYLQFQ